MTCEDCKISDICTDKHKSYKYSEDGDSWANWCDEFQSIFRDKSVVVDGYTITQSGANHHVMIVDKDGNFVMHAACTKDLTEDELRRKLDLYFALVKAERKIKADENDRR